MSNRKEWRERNGARCVFMRVSFYRGKNIDAFDRFVCSNGICCDKKAIGRAFSSGSRLNIPLILDKLLCENETVKCGEVSGAGAWTKRRCGASENHARNAEGKQENGKKWQKKKKKKKTKREKITRSTVLRLIAISLFRFSATETA